MLKKTITYTDFNDVERTEDFYFNLTNSELIQLQASMPDGFDTMIQNLIAAQDVPKLFEIFKEFVLSSYGEKSLDGKRFVKSKELSEEFEQSAAFDVLFSEFIKDPNAFTTFLSGIVPSEIAKKMNSPEVTKMISMPN